MEGQQAAIAEAFSQKLLEAAKVVEEQVDQQMAELDRLDDDDLEVIRQKRISQMKKAATRKEEWLQIGHGKYTEVPDEKAFFAESKKSKRVVVHFYRDSTFRCKIVDKHLLILAEKHLETRFLKLNADKAPFLCQRLNVNTLPTMLFIKDEQTIGRMIGFTQLGDVDDFPTDLLEWRLGGYEMIHYSGDLTKPPSGPDAPKQPSVNIVSKKTIRGQKAQEDSDDDW